MSYYYQDPTNPELRNMLLEIAELKMEHRYLSFILTHQKNKMDPQVESLYLSKLNNIECKITVLEICTDSPISFPGCSAD